ncbi:tyrosine-type recombinase/integrase [Homoserinimonas sp. A520]
MGKSDGATGAERQPAPRAVQRRGECGARGWRIYVGTPKTHEKRSVPYPARLAPLIGAACASKGPDGLLFGNGRDAHEGRGRRSRLVCHPRATCPEDRSADAARHLHDLRHTAASLAISSGANVKAVERMLGHASAAMTLDTYADLFDDELDAVASKLNEAIIDIAWPVKLTPTLYPRADCSGDQALTLESAGLGLRGAQKQPSGGHQDSRFFSPTSNLGGQNVGKNAEKTTGLRQNP